MQLTAEQLAVIRHPVGQHARVMAVAGSGKTTTMTYRVRHLVERVGVSSHAVGLLMFNRLARQQFGARLAAAGMPRHLRPSVNTFHSFAYTLLNDAVQRGICDPVKEKWFSENREEARRQVLRILQQMERDRDIKPGSIDAEDALTAISLWKAALIPPERAGFKGTRKLPQVYLRFEEERTRRGALTFDDFLPMAVGLLEREGAVGARWLQRYQFLIVDEYQDVNYGQQRLIELLAGDRADIMVVGDDDQTIYEWRGARPGYIIRDYKARFDNKPVQDYTLSHSFRFGPLIAQCAHNCVSYNQVRVPQRVIAHQPTQPASIQIYQGEPLNHWAVNETLADIITRHIQGGGDVQKLIVLGRMYSQMNGLELALLTRQQPYRVEGNAPLTERREIVALLDYVRLARSLDETATQKHAQLVLSTANTPNRMLRRAHLSDVLNQAVRSGQTVRVALEYLTDPATTPFNQFSAGAMDDYLQTLEMLSETSHESAGDVLTWLVGYIGYEQHFDDYYGLSETAEDRKRAVAAVCHYATHQQMTLTDFLAHVESLDTTHGAPLSQQVVLTSIYRVKGLEYDTVILPDCNEGYLPCLVEPDSPIYDTAGQVEEPEVSVGVDDERRLFYVALTRAKQHVHISTVRPPTDEEWKNEPPLPSRFLDEIALPIAQSVAHHLEQEDAAALRELVLDEDTPLTVGWNLTKHYLPLLGETDDDGALHAALQQREAKQKAQAEAAAEVDLGAFVSVQSLPLDADTKDYASKMQHTIEHNPRAYRAWTEDEEQEMMRMLDAGRSVGAVADKLQRTPGAIIARRRKLQEDA